MKVWLDGGAKYMEWEGRERNRKSSPEVLIERIK